MKISTALVILLMLAGMAPAGEIGEFLVSAGVPNPPAAKPGYIKSTGTIPDEFIRLQGGDNIATATPITAVPASYTGTTIGYTNDYLEICPWDDFAPDVVYSYMPNLSMYFLISLCQSEFDTKIYVYEETAGNLVACNDDACGVDGYRSEIPYVFLNAGTTYYIVIDGYMNEQGNYTFEFIPLLVDCILEIPPGAVIEDEPTCYDDYYDSHNGGCGSDPVVWDTIAVGSEIWGSSGTFLYQGLQFRDTDWYEFEFAELSRVTYQGVGEFPIQLVLLRQGENEPCLDYEIIDFAMAPTCTTAVIDTVLAAGRYWAWVAPSVFDNVECSSNYILSLTAEIFCEIECPPNSIQEDEPICYDNFEDIYNGGCNNNPVVWDTVAVGSTICGTSGTYQYQGSNYRDEDWYAFELDWESSVHIEGESDFQSAISIFIQGTANPCNFDYVKTVLVQPCSLAIIDTVIPEGRYWIWVGPVVLEGVDCGSTYYFTLETAHTDICDIVAGDANGDGVASGVDVIFMVNWLKGGPIPPPDICQCPNNLYAAADFNGNCSFNGLDVTSAVGFFKGGPFGPWVCPLCPQGN